MAVRRHVLAMGGGFLADPENNLGLERYFRELTGKSSPKVLFVPTASGDNEPYQLRFFQAFTKLGCQPEVLPFFKRTPQKLEEFVLDHDAIAVGGGNTRTMLAIWRDWGLDAILRKAYDRGIVMGGSSAGSICWFEDGITDSIAGPLTHLPCLGFVKGSNCPHYDSEKDRRPTYQAMIRAGAVKDGHAADDSTGLHFIDSEFIQAVASRPKSMAWSVYRAGAEVVEEAIEPTRLA
jgi:peptidase E